MKWIVFAVAIFGFLEIAQCNDTQQKENFNTWLNFFNTVGHSLSNLSRRQQNVESSRREGVNNETSVDFPQNVLGLNLKSNEIQNEQQTSENFQSSAKRRGSKKINSKLLKKTNRKLRQKTNTGNGQQHGNVGMSEILRDDAFAGTILNNKDRREQTNKGGLRKLFKQSKYKGINLNHYERAEWRINIPVNKFRDIKVREVAFYNRTKRQVTVITSSKYKKTGFSASTNMRDYNVNLMAIKTFTSRGLACFIGNIDKSLDDTIALIKQRNTSKDFISLKDEITLKADNLTGDVNSIGEILLEFCSTRYGDVKLYTLSDYTETDPAEVKLKFPVYEKEVVYAGSSVRERLKVISLFGTFVIHI